MKTIFEYYKEIITLIGSLTGFLGIIATIYFKHKDSLIKQKEIELKKEQFKEDKQYQISKEKFQILFEKKIDLYEKIYHEVNILNSSKHQINIEDYDINPEGNMIDSTLKEEDLYFKKFINIHNLIENNQLLISERIFELNQRIFDKHESFSIKFNKEIEELSPNEIDISECKKEFCEFYFENKSDFIEFFKVIEEEMKNIRKKLDFI
ncbi:hypothetical protein ACOL3G_11280 [Aliarcobacter butzleri]